MAYTLEQLRDPWTQSSAGDGGKSSPRSSPITQVGWHHTAGGTIASTTRMMADPWGRGVSSQGVLSGLRRAPVTAMGRRAFTSGSSSDGGRGAALDHRSATYEVVNDIGAPHWDFSDDTYESCAVMAAYHYLVNGVPLREARTLTDPGHWTHGGAYTKWSASYPTACPGSLSVPRILREAQALIDAALGAAFPIGDTMPVVRITDWNGRHYLADSLGHTYIPSLTAASALIKMARQDAAIDLDFASFFEAVSLTNTNLRGSVLGKGLDALAPKATVRMASASMTRSARPDWCDPDVWDEAVKRGIAKA